MTDNTWKVGDECVVENPNNLECIGEFKQYLGQEGVVMALFTNSLEIRMATVNYSDGRCICWRLEMLQKPIKYNDGEWYPVTVRNLEKSKRVMVFNDGGFRISIDNVVLWREDELIIGESLGKLEFVEK